jgi:hypothetical protein
MATQFRRKCAIALAIATASASASLLQGATISWSNAGGGNFNTASNWNSGAGPVPGSADTAQFNILTTYNVVLDINPSINAMLVGGSNLGLLNAVSGRKFSVAGTLNVNSGSMTLDPSVPVTMTVGNNTNFNANVTVSGGSELDLASLAVGPAGNSLLTIDGAGTILSDTLTNLGLGAGTQGILRFQNGSIGKLQSISLATSGSGTGAFQVLSGADVSVTSGDLRVATNVVSGTNGQVIIDGVGTSLTDDGQIAIGAGSLSSASMTVSNSAVVSCGALSVASTGRLDINSGASVSSNNLVRVLTGSGAQGIITIGGAGAALTQSGAFSFSIGGNSGSASTLQINAGGICTTGTGGTLVNATGLLNINDGTLNANGDISITGGTFQRSTDATFNWAPGRTMRVQSGGQMKLSGPVSLPANSIVNVTGSGSILSQLPSDTLNFADALNVGSSSTINISSSGELTATALNVGTNGAGTVSIDAGTLQVSGAVGTTQLGGGGSAGSMTLSNGAQATLGAILIGGNSAGSNGTFMIQGGADVTTADRAITIGNAGSDGTMTLTGTGSTLLQSGIIGVNVGPAGANSGTLNVLSGAAFTTGTGATTFVGPTGLLNLDGGRYTARGDVIVDGGTFQRTATLGSAFVWQSSGSMTVQDGGKITLNSTVLSGSNSITVTGAGSLLSAPGGTINVAVDHELDVTTGATVSADQIQTSTAGTGTAKILIDGAGSTLTSTGTGPIFWGGGATTSNITFQNGATGSINNPIFLPTGGAPPTAILNIQSGASFTMDNLNVGSSNIAGATGTINLDGPGSSLGGRFLTIGGDHDSIGTVNVSHDAVLSLEAPGAATDLLPTGVLNINGGTAQLGVLIYHPGAQVNLNSGSLTFIGDLPVDATGPLGGNITLDAGKSVSLNGTTTVTSPHSLRLDGGTLSTAQLTSDGGFIFNSGTLDLTGAGGLSIGAAGALGDTLVVGAGQTINVTHATTVDPTGTLVIGDGRFNADGGILNNGEVRLSGIAPRLSGAITNNRLIRGDGRIDGGVSNESSGEIRAESGKALLLSGINGPNAGRINLQGGTIEFEQALVNDGSGVIAGRGFVFADAGLTNNGQIQLSSEATDVHGSLANTSGAKIIVSGGATATFYDPVTLASGSEFRVSTGSTAVFFADVSGTSNFTGTGTKDFEAGSSALTAIQTQGSTTVQSGASLSTGNIRENALSVAGRMTITPGASASKLGSLDVTGQLDLTDNKLIVAGADAGTWSGSSYTGVSGLVQSGRSGGAWNGHGIITTSVSGATDKLHSIGIATADELGMVGQTFGGLNLQSGDVLVMFTYGGDANLDGKINIDDYGLIDAHVGQSGSAFGWHNGDFNYDGKINIDDYGIIDANIGAQTGTLGAASSEVSGVASVPEPGFAAPILGLLAMGTQLRRRRTTRVV